MKNDRIFEIHIEQNTGWRVTRASERQCLFLNSTPLLVSHAISVSISQPALKKLDNRQPISHLLIRCITESTAVSSGNRRFERTCLFNILGKRICLVRKRREVVKQSSTKRIKLFITTAVSLLVRYSIFESHHYKAEIRSMMCVCVTKHKFYYTTVPRNCFVFPYTNCSSLEQGGQNTAWMDFFVTWTAVRLSTLGTSDTICPIVRVPYHGWWWWLW
jgi:hypothetical protein